MRTTVHTIIQLGNTIPIIEKGNENVSLSCYRNGERLSIEFTTAHINTISKLLEQLQKLAEQEKIQRRRNLETELAAIEAELEPASTQHPEMATCENGNGSNEITKIADNF
jgi:hypothetical protein